MLHQRLLRVNIPCRPFWLNSFEIAVEIKRG